jgi:glycosyltransferase involved in cell wall biosynthesis
LGELVIEEPKIDHMKMNSHQQATRAEVAPMVSIIMPVFNASEFLDGALTSIQNQTWKDWELVIVDDCSEDDSWDKLTRVTDERVRVYRNPHNMGIAASLNKGISVSHGRFIARTDADDISHPMRIELQLRHLMANPDIGLLGTNYLIVDERGGEIGRTNLFTHPDDLKLALVVSNQFGHGTVMMTRSAFNAVGGYGIKSSIEEVVEDYELWTRISHVALVANLPKHLYSWRSHTSGWTARSQERQLESTYAIRDREFTRLTSNRGEYKLFSIHPTGIGYLKKKSYMFRDLAYLAQREGHARLALTFMTAAVLVAPWRKGNYLYLFLLVLNKRLFLERVPYVYV